MENDTEFDTSGVASSDAAVAARLEPVDPPAADAAVDLHTATIDSHTAAIADIREAHTRLQYGQISVATDLRAAVFTIINHLDPAGTSFAFKELRELFR